MAEELAPAFPDGVHFVDLAAATEHSMAWTTLAETLGRSGEQQAALLDHLRDRRVLVVLDNLEQLPNSGAPVVSALLGATAPGARARDQPPPAAASRASRSTPCRHSGCPTGTSAP